MRRVLGWCLVWSLLNANAQMSDLEITWGDEFETPRRSFITGLIDMDSAGVYGLRERFTLGGPEYYIEKYVDLKPRNMVKQERDHKGTVSYSREILKVGKDMWELTYQGTREQKLLTAKYFDMESLKPSGDVIEIFNIPLVRKLRYTYGTFSYNYSEDFSKTVFVTEFPGDYDEEAKLGVQVRDELFYLIWEDEVTFPYPKERVDLEYSDVSDQGLAIFMLKVYEESKMSADRRGIAYWYEMMTLDSTGVPHTYKLQLEDKTIHSGHFEVVKSNFLVCAGFYGLNRFQIDGSFFMQIDLVNGQMKHLHTREFDLAFLKEGQSDFAARRISKRAEKGKSVGLDNIYFRDFVLRDDGSVCLIGEYYDLVVNTNSDPNSSNTTTSYIFKDIVIVSIDPYGNVEWAKKVLKRQITSDDGGLMSGFALFDHGGKLYFIFNDHQDNLNAKDYSDLRTWSRKRRTSIVCLVTVDRQGMISRESIISQRKLGLELIPQSCRQISDTEMILVTYKRKENQIARLVAR